jgi:phosphoglycolate phosphatase
VIRNIIFDWSGTLVDDLPVVWRATNFVFSQAGIAELTIEQFRAEFCLPFTRFYERYLPQVAMTQLEEWFHAHFKQAQIAVEEIPHARAFLEFCKAAGVRTFLLSSVHSDHYAMQTETTRLNEFIDRAYIQVWDKRMKIAEILQENRLAPDETLFIGDMQHDVETAKHGGIHSCAVLTGYNSLAQLRAAEPDLIVEHLGELQRILERNAFHLRKSLHPDDQRQPIVTVGALIFNQRNEVLMIQTQKWSNLWGIPGGKTHFGETSIDALRREIKEETNLDIDDIQFVLVQDCIHSKEFYRDEHFVLLNYTCRVASLSHEQTATDRSDSLSPPSGEGQGEGSCASVKLNEEATQFRWLTLDQAFALPLNTPTQILLRAVREEAQQASSFPRKGSL